MDVHEIKPGSKLIMADMRLAEYSKIHIRAVINLCEMFELLIQEYIKNNQSS